MSNSPPVLWFIAIRFRAVLLRQFSAACLPCFRSSLEPLEAHWAAWWRAMELLALLSRRLHHAIDSANLHDINPPYPIILLVCILLISLYLLLPFLHDAERPVQYSVKEPEQSQPGWRGEILEKPSIQVLTQTHFVC
jgi:hypothetical protein